MGTPVRIPVRRMDFEFGGLPKYWYNGNPWITHYLNAMSAVFPDGERFFIRSVRNVQDQVTDPVLQAQVRAFIGQEANHGKEHEAFNRLLEERHGVPMASTANFTRRWLLGIAGRLPQRRQLAITIALEHFTAILANQLLEQPEIAEQLGRAEGEMFLWHAVEETEHKAVAFDVYTAVYGRGFTSTFVRMMTMVVTTFMFSLFTTAFQLRFLWRDGELFNLRAMAGFIAFMWWKPGPLRRMLPDYLDYYRPSFHPWMHDNRALIRERVDTLAGKELRAGA